MEKEQILSTLNEQLGKTSLSARTISDYVDGFMPAEGESFDFDKHVKILKSLQGNFSNDVAATVEDFKKNYKPKTDPTPNPSNDDAMTKLLARLEALEKTNADNAKNATTSALRNEVTAMGKSLKVANEAIWEDAVSSVAIGDTSTAETIVADAKRAYEKMLRRYVGEGAEPYAKNGRQGASKEAEQMAKERRDALKKKMQSRGRLPKQENNNL